ncbi:hypothetical protein [Leifsonia aquatica]|uniref:hypothetical protein n=1 Tax=Leifsonia aquatica TaxID=144185 RepID=UPI0038087823
MAELATPKVVVLIEQDGTDDLLEYTVQTDNRDMIQWDVTRGKKGWPKFDEAATLWLTFLAWHALRRVGETTLTLDDFLRRTVSVSRPKDEAGNEVTDEEMVALPTNPVAGTDS